MMLPVFAALVLASTSGAASTVSQKERRFDPQEVVLAAGETLRILNDDRFTHHVLARGPGLEVDSGVQRPGEWIEIAFAKQGIYEITCDIHPKMHLKVVAE